MTDEELVRTHKDIMLGVEAGYQYPPKVAQMMVDRIETLKTEVARLDAGWQVANAAALTNALDWDAASAAAYEAASEIAAEFVHRRLYEANMPACSYHSRDIKTAIRALATPDQTSALDRVRAEAKAEALQGPWSDKPDDLTEAVMASHPVETKDYTTYGRALDLVSNRHSKGALVGLVNHLLAAILKEGV